MYDPFCSIVLIPIDKIDKISNRTKWIIHNSNIQAFY